MRSRRASSLSRASRGATVRLTARGPTARTASARAATGATPSSSSAPASSRTSSGLPPVAVCTAATNGASASPRRSASSAFTAVGAERAGREHGRGRLAHGVEQVLVDVGLARADGRQQQHGQLLDAARQVGQEAQRRRVRPVEVLDRQQQRSVAGEVEHRPEQPVQDREAALRLLAAGIGQDRARRGRARRGRGPRPRAAGARRRRRSRAPAGRHARTATACRRRSGGEPRRGSRTCRCPPGPRSGRRIRCRVRRSGRRPQWQPVRGRVPAAP